MEAATDDYWQADRLKRRADCKLFAEYIVSRARQRLDRRSGDGSFVVGVRGPYGSGKTFFLRGLKHMLSASHPVAYLDAWESDSLGDPMMALVDALQRALDRFVEAPDTSEKIRGVVSNLHKIGGALVWGVTKAGAKRYAGEEFGDAISNSMTFSAGDAAKDAETGQAISSEAVDGGERALKDVRLPVRTLIARTTAMQKAAWDEARGALKDLRANLSRIVDLLAECKDLSAPIVIIVDELDRCRPDYAVSMLEEIKHFFAVPGIVFVLGMERDQLAKSIAGVYGATFDGAAYLQRFTQFDYTLSEPEMLAFVKARLDDDPFDDDAFANDIANQSHVHELARFFFAMRCSLRETDQILEKLRVAACVGSSNGVLSLTLLAILALEDIRGEPFRGTLDKLPNDRLPQRGIEISARAGIMAVSNPIELIILYGECREHHLAAVARVDEGGEFSRLSTAEHHVALQLYYAANRSSDNPRIAHRRVLNRVAGFTS